MTIYVQRRPVRVDLLSPRVWRPIVAHPTHEVSDCGQVRNRRTQRMLRLSASGDYSAVSFHVGNKRIAHRVHTLVCRAFNGPPPTSKHEAAHNNGDGRDNRADNIRWATHAENLADKRVHGTYKDPPWRGGEKHHLAVLTEDDVREIRRLAVDGMGHREIAALFQVDKATAGRVIRRQTWRHVT